MLVTDQVFQAYLHCPTKAYLKAAGVTATPTEILEWRQHVLGGYTQECSEQLGARFAPNERLVGASFSNFDDEQVRLIIDCSIRSPEIESRVHAIERLSLPGKAEHAPFLPIRFVPTEKLTTNDKLLLGFNALALQAVLGEPPPFGRILHGRQRNMIRVPVAGLIARVQATIDTMEALQIGSAVPELVLNRHCSECEYQHRCRQIASETDDLGLLSGMSEAERKQSNRKGIFTVTQLAYTFRPRRRPKHLRSRSEKYHHAIRALAIRDNKVYVVGNPQLGLTGTPIYLDVEGLPDRDCYYLIGIRMKQGDSCIQHSFWAETASDEHAIWASFVRELEKVHDPQLIHYGSYETEFLKRMKERYCVNDTTLHFVEKLAAASVNVLSTVYAQVYFPTYSNSLKDTARFLGFRWSDTASGLDALVWREKWESTGTQLWKNKLITYNADDCEALERVTTAIVQVTTWPSNLSLPGVSAPVSGTLPEPEAPYAFGKVKFALPEMKHINECAYWDYQRDRIYLRSKNAPRKPKGALPTKYTAPLPVDKVVEYPLRQSCPECQGKNPKRVQRKEKTIFDLKFGRAGVRRWIVKYVYARYECYRCGSRFNAEGPTWTASRYGHGLLAYMVYLTIEVGVSLKSVAQNIKDLFAYGFRFNVIADQKSRASLQYKDTYENILNVIVNGRVIYADETRIALKGKEAYVWVLASAREVVYLYSDTREGRTIQNRLQGFNGVLVSDFYAVYDSIDCLQQKCLIHLIRDLNEDLLNEPFNEEYKQLVINFVDLLKPIIETIDRFGLKAHWLGGHRAAVVQFYHNLSQQEYSSATAAKYKQRFEKNRNKLFTFLDHDGVSWNNNNAEHAIKRFAALRERIEGSTTEQGLKEYLTLLSISETCRCRGTSFLSFLRSGRTAFE